MSSASVASSSQRSRLLGARRARRRAPRSPAPAAAARARRRARPRAARRRRRAGGRARRSVSTTSTLSLRRRRRRGPGSGRRRAAGCRRSRTARIRRAGPETRILPDQSRSVAAGLARLPPPLPLLAVVGQRVLRRARSAPPGFRSGRGGRSGAATGRVSAGRRTAASSGPPSSGVVADVDVVVVVGQREAGFAGQVLERDHLVGVHRALQLQHRRGSARRSACPGPGGRSPGRR